MIHVVNENDITMLRQAAELVERHAPSAYWHLACELSQLAERLVLASADLREGEDGCGACGAALGVHESWCIHNRPPYGFAAAILRRSAEFIAQSSPDKIEMVRGLIEMAESCEQSLAAQVSGADGWYGQGWRVAIFGEPLLTLLDQAAQVLRQTGTEGGVFLADLLQSVAKNFWFWAKRFPISTAEWDEPSDSGFLGIMQQMGWAPPGGEQDEAPGVGYGDRA